MIFILGLIIGVLLGVLMTSILSVDNIQGEPWDGIFLNEDERDVEIKKDLTSGK